MKNEKSGILTGQVDVISIGKDLFRQWWVILLLSLAVSMFANVWTNVRYKPEYTSTTTFVVTTKGMNTNIYQNLTSAQELANSFSQILDSNVLKKKVAEDLGMETFAAHTSANILPETNLIELSVTADSAMEAYNVMNSIMNNYNSVSDYVIENVILEVIQQPEIPMAPSNPLNVKGVMKKSFLAALLLLTACFALLSYMKDTVKNEREVSEKLVTNLLGTICHERKARSLQGLKKAKDVSLLISNPMLSFRFVEANKMTASKIRNRMNRKGYKVLLVTSVGENEGKSTVAANLAYAMAQSGSNVLLMDCDFRKPAQYKIFDAEDDAVNLPEVLENRKGSSDILKKQKNVRLYTIFNCVPTTSLEKLLENGTLGKMLDFLREKMDYIIIDSSPMALVADTEELAHMADATVLVVRQDMVLAKDINDVVDTLNKTKGKVMGCIFNDVVTGFTGNSSRYGGYYGYGGEYGKRTAK